MYIRYIYYDRLNIFIALNDCTLLRIDVDVGVKEESIAARIKGLTIEGDIDNDSDGTQTGFLGAVTEFGDSDKTSRKRDVNKRHRRIQASRKLVKGFY